jgi:hypothetical protein
VVEKSLLEMVDDVGIGERRILITDSVIMNITMRNGVEEMRNVLGIHVQGGQLGEYVEKILLGQGTGHGRRMDSQVNFKPTRSQQSSIHIGQGTTSSNNDNGRIGGR